MNVSKAIAHPGYKWPVKYHDIGLIELIQSIIFNEYVRPACLNVDENLTWDYAIASGYGQSSFGGFFLLFAVFIDFIFIFVTTTENKNKIGTLMKVTLRHIDDSDCRLTYKVNWTILLMVYYVQEVLDLNRQTIL